LRLTFAKGYQLKDPKGLLGGLRAMTIREGDKLNEKAFKDLIRTAVTLNLENKSAKVKKPNK
jgi:hypothetical protein